MRRDVQEIFIKTKIQKQVMMFSATFTPEVKDICRKFMRKVQHPPQAATRDSCRQPEEADPSRSGTVLLGDHGRREDQGLGWTPQEAAIQPVCHLHQIGRQSQVPGRSSPEVRPQVGINLQRNGSGQEVLAILRTDLRCSEASKSSEPESLSPLT